MLGIFFWGTIWRRFWSIIPSRHTCSLFSSVSSQSAAKKRLQEKDLSSADPKWICCKFYLLSLISPLQIHIMAFFLCHEWVLTYHMLFYGPDRVQNEPAVTSVDYRLNFTIHCFKLEFFLSRWECRQVHLGWLYACVDNSILFNLGLLEEGNIL